MIMYLRCTSLAELHFSIRSKRLMEAVPDVSQVHKARSAETSVGDGCASLGNEACGARAPSYSNTSNLLRLRS